MELIKIPVHQISFNHDEDLENIYKISGICHTIVKFEPMKNTSNKIPQCKRCQSFGHTLNYCQKQARCVKCAGKHLTRDCTCAKKNINP